MGKLSDIFNMKIKSRNYREGKYSGKLGQNHGRDQFSTCVMSFSLGCANRTQRKSRAMALKNYDPADDDIPY